MKKNILIFAGTTEGRQLAEYAVKKGIPCIVSAATEYWKMICSCEKRSIGNQNFE